MLAITSRSRLKPLAQALSTLIANRALSIYGSIPIAFCAQFEDLLGARARIYTVLSHTESNDMQTRRASDNRRVRWELGDDPSLFGAYGPTIPGFAVRVAVGSSFGLPLRLPEVDLVAAILEEAVRCIQGPNRSVTRRQHQEALQWITVERHDWPFSFINVCKLLGMDAGAVRSGLGVPGSRTEAPQPIC
jgi:hypothetical protein